ncbi:hypothetical protein [Nostoc sp. MG11]|nr:hypothetical protein [Nostoc sp. MG11]
MTQPSENLGVYELILPTYTQMLVFERAKPEFISNCVLNLA